MEAQKCKKCKGEGKHRDGSKCKWCNGTGTYSSPKEGE